jgi:flavodoxin I
LIYASESGITEIVVDRISEMTGLEGIQIEKVKDAEDLLQYDAMIVGTPTHNTLVDEYRSGTGWDDIIDDVKALDFTGKVIAVFGTGDSVSYGEGFCDAMEELHRTFETAGATMVGYVDSSGYQHESSKCDFDGKFVGLALDEMNEEHMTEQRLTSWISQLKEEGMEL